MPAEQATPGQAAPELTAALAETRLVRDGYQALCKEFGPSPQTGWSARISLTVLNRHRDTAGLERYTRTESNQREDAMLRYRRERDEAREQLGEIQAMVDAAPRAASAEQLAIVLRAIREVAREALERGQ